MVRGNAFFITQVLISQWNISDNNTLGVKIPDAQTILTENGM